MFKLFFALVSTLITPSWDLTQWQSITQTCSTITNEILTMRCESAGLVSKQWYSGTIDVSVDILAYPVGSVQQYWTGLALNSNVTSDDSYAQVALTQAIQPFNDVNQPSAVLLSTTGKDNCCQVVTSIDKSAWHTLHIHYSNGKATYTIDNMSKTVNVRLSKWYQIELLCVAVNPGTHIDNALTECNFKHLRITQ